MINAVRTRQRVPTHPRKLRGSNHALAVLGQSGSYEDVVRLGDHVTNLSCGEGKAGRHLEYHTKVQKKIFQRKT